MTASIVIGTRSQKFFGSESNRGIGQGGGTGAAGAGSLDNDKIKYCKIFAANHFPHEQIVFKKSWVVEELYSIDFIVSTKILIEKWVPFGYFRLYQCHDHKSRRDVMEDETN